jgi:hypothetical protein
VQADEVELERRPTGVQAGGAGHGLVADHEAVRSVGEGRSGQDENERGESGANQGHHGTSAFWEGKQRPSRRSRAKT